MYEIGIKIYNSISQGWLKINVTQTADEDGACWHFLHLVDRLQKQGWSLTTGRHDPADGLLDDDSLLTQALRSWTNAGRG